MENPLVRVEHPSVRVDWRHAREIDSTQTYVENHCQEFDQTKVTVISADHQTAGRGNQSGTRTWCMKEGDGVLMTFYFKAANAEAKKHDARRVLSLAAQRTLEGIGVKGDFHVKWQSEVVLNGKKVSGNLASAVPSDPASPHERDAIVIGIGISVNNEEGNLLQTDRPAIPGTSLFVETNKKFDVAGIRSALVTNFVNLLDEFLSSGIDPLLNELSSNYYILGQPVLFTDAHSGLTHKGIFKSCGSDDCVVLECDGVQRRFSDGEMLPWLDDLSENMGLQCFGSVAESCNWIHFPQVASTQDYVEEHFRSFAQSKLTVVSADFQTKGRGTRDRQWFADRGVNALITFFFRFPMTCDKAFVTKHLANTTQILSLSAVQTLKSFTDGDERAKFGMKWPNDIICNNRKIGGILAKGVTTGKHFDGVVIGIGININMAQESLDKIDRPVWPPTSLCAQLGKVFDVAAFRTQLAERFCGNLAQFFVGGLDKFLDEINRCQILVNQRIAFRLSESNIVRGVYMGLTESGAIIIDDQQFVNGEIIQEDYE